MEEVALLGENLDISTLEELLRQARSRGEDRNEQPEDIHEVIPQVEPVFKNSSLKNYGNLVVYGTQVFHSTKTGLLKQTLGRNYPKFLTAMVSYSEKKYNYILFALSMQGKSGQATNFTNLSDFTIPRIVHIMRCI